MTSNQGDPFVASLQRMGIYIHVYPTRVRSGKVRLRAVLNEFDKDYIPTVYSRTAFFAPRASNVVPSLSCCLSRSSECITNSNYPQINVTI